MQRCIGKFLNGYTRPPYSKLALSLDETTSSQDQLFRRKSTQPSKSVQCHSSHHLTCLETPQHQQFCSNPIRPNMENLPVNKIAAKARNYRDERWNKAAPTLAGRLLDGITPQPIAPGRKKFRHTSHQRCQQM